MAGCAAKHHARKFGLGESGETDPAGRGRTQGVINFLQGGGPSNITVCFGDVGTFSGNGEEGRSGTHRLPQTDHGEVSAADRRRDVGDDWGGSSVGSVRNAVGDDLIGRRQANLAQWVALRSIFEVCEGDKGYKGGGRKRENWWRQEVTEK